LLKTRPPGRNVCTGSDFARTHHHRDEQGDGGDGQEGDQGVDVGGAGCLKSRIATK